ncbi:WYL domain-containing protein [Sphingomonas sp.]|uniref:WYL domain-containing protein n=1 Tax=Sphingomonas sp. TaxID=28214 RepID=UPI003CC5F126
MNVWRRLLTWLAVHPRPATRWPVLVPGEFLGRAALVSRFAERRAVIGYMDASGQPTLRMVTFDELLDQNGHRYLSGYCHERFDRRHFRLDRITFMHRYGTGEHVEPAREVARWLQGA